MKAESPARSLCSPACALVLLAAWVLPHPSAAAVQIFSRITTNFDPSLGLTPAQQADLSSAIAAQVASRIAVTEDWNCVKPPSVKPPAPKNEGIPAQIATPPPGLKLGAIPSPTDNQLYEIIELDVGVKAGGINVGIWRDRGNDYNGNTTLASFGLPLNISDLGQGDALEAKLADLLALAVDSAMVQAHPCGRWTGKIEYRNERTTGSHTKWEDRSFHSLLDITITFTNRREAAAHTHLDEKSTSESRVTASTGDTSDPVPDSWGKITTKGDGDTKATYRVAIVPETKTYTISVSVPPITAHTHGEVGGRASPPRTTSDFDHAVQWYQTDLAGRLDDPKHLHGRNPLVDSKTETETKTATEEWDLQWEP